MKLKLGWNRGGDSKPAPSNRAAEMRKNFLAFPLEKKYTQNNGSVPSQKGRFNF
ncbi:MAG: hypothetical protein IJO45_04410 [Oscillospiraceae bacterium]|nr:hypothetical protein [Oscillospiraceae bacterium]